MEEGLGAFAGGEEDCEVGEEGGGEEEGDEQPPGEVHGAGVEHSMVAGTVHT